LASIGLGGTWLVALPALAVAALVWRVGPRIAARREATVSLRTVLRRERRMLVGLVAVSATRSWASSLVTSFLPLYAVARGADLIASSRLLTAFLLAGAFRGLAGGWLAHRFGRARVVLARLLAPAPSAALLAVPTQ